MKCINLVDNLNHSAVLITAKFFLTIGNLGDKISAILSLNSVVLSLTFVKV